MMYSRAFYGPWAISDPLIFPVRLHEVNRVLEHKWKKSIYAMQDIQLGGFYFEKEAFIIYSGMHMSMYMLLQTLLAQKHLEAS